MQNYESHSLNLSENHIICVNEISKERGKLNFSLWIYFLWKWKICLHQHTIRQWPNYCQEEATETQIGVNQIFLVHCIIIQVWNQNWKNLRSTMVEIETYYAWTEPSQCHTGKNRDDLAKISWDQFISKIFYNLISRNKVKILWLTLKHDIFLKFQE